MKLHREVGVCSGKYEIVFPTGRSPALLWLGVRDELKSEAALKEAVRRGLKSLPLTNTKTSPQSIPCL